MSSALMIERCTGTLVKGPSTPTGSEQTIISNATCDRDGDTIDPKGVDLENFRKNGPILFAHRSDELPVGQAEQVWMDTQGNLRMQWRWLEGDDFAARVRNAWQQGILRGASVGFLPKSSTGNKHGGRNFDAWELLEVSLCAIPSNPTAVRTLQKMGLWEDAPRQGRKDIELDCTPEEVAQMVRRIADPLIRQAKEARARERANEFDLPVSEAQLRRMIAKSVLDARDAVIEEAVTTACRRLQGKVD